MTALATVSPDFLEREIETRYHCRAVPIKKEIVKAMVGDRVFTVLVTTFELLARDSMEYCSAWMAPSADGFGKLTLMRRVQKLRVSPPKTPSGRG